MAKRKSKTQKKVEKEVKKQAKKHPVATILVLVAVLSIAAVGGFLLYKYGYLDGLINPNHSSSSNQDSSSMNSQENDGFDDLSFHFISAGKSGTLYNGDCIYIKAGEADVLIDSGKMQSNYASIAAEINKHCTDNKLEYVIATHTDADHLGGFIGTGKKAYFILIMSEQ